MFLAWLTCLVMVLRSSVSEWPQCGGRGPGQDHLWRGQAMNARKWPLVIRSPRHRGIFSPAGSHETRGPGDRSPDGIRKWRPLVIDLESIKSNQHYCIYLGSI